MLSVPTRSRITLALRVFVFVHAYIAIFVFITDYLMESKSIEGRITPLSRIDITIHCAIIASAIIRVIAIGSARAIHTQVALYTWTLDLASRVAIVGYDIATAEPGIMTLASVLATRQIWTELGAYLLAGVGLKMNLDEVREVDLKALQRRVMKDRSVAAEQRQGCERGGGGVGGKGQVEEKGEDEDEEPLTLRNLLGATWQTLGWFFLSGLSANRGRIIIAAGNYPWFVMTAIAFNMGVGVFGLFVLTGASRRQAQVVYYALLCGVLIDVVLTVIGHSRFINESDTQLLTRILSNFIQLPTRLPWVYPTVDCMFTEIFPVVLLRRVVQDFQRIHDENTKVANGEQ